MGILLLLVTIAGVNAYSNNPSSNWKNVLEEEIEQDLALIAEVKSANDPTNDVYLQNIEQGVLKKQYAIENGINEEYSSVGFIKDNISLTFIIIILLMIQASKIVPNEESLGTIKFLLIRPFTRWKVIISKYIAIMILAMFLYVTLFVLLGIAGLLIYGFDGAQLKTLIVKDGAILEENLMLYVIKQYLYSFIPNFAYVAMGIMFSIVLKSSSFALALSIISATMTGMIAGYLEKFSFAKYLIFNNLNLNEYLYKNGVGGLTSNEVFSISIIIIYSLVFLLISGGIYKRRDFA